MNTAVVVGIVIAVLLLILLATYNGLIHLRQEIRLAWARMDEQLKQRYDLVSALVLMVQSIGGEPAGELTAVIAAKNQAAVAFDPSQLAIAEAALSRAIQQVLTSIDSDPAYHADPKVVSITSQLIANQKRIAQACTHYNHRVDALNSSMSSFPHIITAKMVRLQLQPFFDSHA